MFRTIAVATVLVGMTSVAAQAQGRISVEFRGGVAIPTQDMGPTELSRGLGFEGSASFRVLPHMHVYGGWNRYRFETDKPLAGNNYDVEDTGYVFGLAFRHPMVESIGGWVQAGGVYKHIELENGAGDIVSDSGHELGWEAGAGLSVPLSSSVSLTPGVRYRSFSADLTIGSTTIPVDLSYVAAEIGVSWTPGAARRGVAARVR